MHRGRLSAVGLSVLVALAPAAVRADTIFDVENARANARAGGPLNASDREILERWGCLSGTRSAFCQEIKHGATSGSYRAYRRRVPR